MDSKHQRLANQEVKWYGSDTEELYQTNLNTRFEDLKRYNFVDREFTYKFNSHGFRADEFNSSDKGIMFLGCSHTLGVGLPYESTWPYLVSTELKLKNYNLGLGGTSNDTAFRLAYQWIDCLQPEIVIFLATEATRFELHEDLVNNTVHDISVQNYETYDHSKEFMKYWYSDDTNSNMNYLKNTLAVKQLCVDKNIKYIQHDVYKIGELDKARDLQHHGEQTNRLLAKIFLSKI
jgi:hypothetical protein